VLQRSALAKHIRKGKGLLNLKIVRLLKSKKLSSSNFYSRACFRAATPSRVTTYRYLPKPNESGYSTGYSNLIREGYQSLSNRSTWRPTLLIAPIWTSQPKRGLKLKGRLQPGSRIGEGLVYKDNSVVQQQPFTHRRSNKRLVGWLSTVA
jgi:hypothetical protein